MIRAGLRILIVLAAAAAIGVGYGRYRGVPLVPDVRQVEQKTDERAEWVKQTAITQYDFVRHYEAGKLVIDARPRDQFEEGHLDAPLIMNIPGEEADQHLERALSFMNMPIVLYCSSDDCESAQLLWNAMRSWGFEMKGVRVFHSGWAAIKAAKLPSVSGPDLFQDDVSSEVDDTQMPAAPGAPSDQQPAGVDQHEPGQSQPDEGDAP